jgi:hypothetical protein
MDTHINISSYAENKNSLYTLWDRNLRKSMRRRQVRELVRVIFIVIFILLAVAAVNEWHDLHTAVVLGVLGALVLFTAIKHMVDESNANDLMHWWDIQEALGRLSPLGPRGIY